MTRRQLTNKSKYLTDIGITLSIVGVPLGMYFNYIFPVVKWSPVFMVLSALLTISYKNLILGKFPSFNTTFFIIVVSQVLMLGYGVVSTNMDTQYLTFHLYILGLVIALSSLDNKLQYDNIIVTTFVVSSVCSVLGAYFLSTGLVTGQTAFDLRKEDDKYSILQAFIVAAGALVNFVSALMLLDDKKKWIRYFAILAIALDIYVVLFSEKRTPFIALIISTFIFFRNSRIHLILKRASVFKWALVIFVILIFLFFSPSVQKALDTFGQKTLNGLFNIIWGEGETVDTAGRTRYIIRQWAYDYIEINFSFINYLFGAGYMTRWLDNPVLQSYLDMGLLGLFFYCYIVIAFPVKIMLKTGSSYLILFAVFPCLYNILSCFTSGNPYIYMKYTPVVFLAFVMSLKKTNQNSSLKSRHKKVPILAEKILIVNKA